MELVIEPGKYVVAVSGGVDSMVLLDLLVKQPKLDLVVAHFDHGIREESEQDRIFVQRMAKHHNLPFEYAEGKLGPGASEEAARSARYEFLNRVLQTHGTDAIITAHHQDDLIETAFINLLRGTGRKGLTALKDSDRLKRPLLSFSKQEIINYAKRHGVEWREDVTNQDTQYLRNYIRQNLIPKITKQQRSQLVALLEKLKIVNDESDVEIANYLQSTDSKTIPRNAVVKLDHLEACEIMAGWLRLHGIREFDRTTVERLVIAAKTAMPGTRVNINKKNNLEILHTSLVISSV